MKRDRDGEVIDDDADASVDEQHDCRDGWLGDDDRPRPCPRCRPYLIGREPLARPRPAS